MEPGALTAMHQLSIPQRLLSAVVPVLFVAISYVDPGKWAATVEGGARFGLDLILLLLMFNAAAILCQYLSARIAVITGIDLAKVCSMEYDSMTCVVLGAQAEVSMIALDLMMVVGTAHGLNVLFGIDLFTGVLLTAVNTLALPFLAIFLEDGQARLLSICLSVVVLLFYVFEVLINQPRNPPPSGGIMARLNGESVYALMSLLGASIMPHNFYLHSSVVQQDSLSKNVPKAVLCHDHLFAILSVFSGAFLLHYEIMSSAAIELSSLSTFQDTLDQVFRSSIAPLALILLIFFSNQVMALSWNLGGQVVVHDLLKLDIPGWLHHVTVRIIAIIPALCCAWSSGAEGIYQMLIVAQVMVALMLPSSVIPLFRVASSSSIMGIHKISRIEEFLTLVIFVGMLGLNVSFFMELTFGNTEWANNMWETGSSIPIACVILVISTSVSFCLMLWLVATPLKSASSRIEAQVDDWNRDIQIPGLESFLQREQNDLAVSEDQVAAIEKQDPEMELENPLGSVQDLSTSTAKLNLPDTLYDSEEAFHLATVDGKKSGTAFPFSSTVYNEVASTEGETYLDSAAHEDSFDGESQDALTVRNESGDIAEKPLKMDEDLQGSKDDGELWQPEETTKSGPDTNQSLMSDGPGSFRSLGGKGDEPGSGTGSLSKLAGLGRAGRRQLTAVLDEFWGQMFDFHGQVTAEARAKKLDALLGLASKVDSKSFSSASVKMDNRAKELSGYIPSSGSDGPDSMITSLYNSSNQQVGQNMFGSSYAMQRSSPSLWTTQLRQLDAYGRRNAMDYGERRYSSMRIPSSSDSYEQQPATVQGYELAAYLSQMSKGGDPGFLNNQIEPLARKSTYFTQTPNERDLGPLGGGQVELLAPKSTSLTTSRLGDSVARPFMKKPPNGVSSLTPPGFENVSISRNNSLRLDKSMYNMSSPKPVESNNSSAEAKKFYSLPDISGLRIPHQDPSGFGQSQQWDNSLSYGVGSPNYERISSDSQSRGAASFRSEGFSSSEVCRDPFALQYGSSSSAASLWSRQPFEQFGVAEKIHFEGEQAKKSSGQETVSVIDTEAKILQSFRYCIMKLLKLDGSEWLFRQNDGVDEDLIDRVAAREKFLYEAESAQMDQAHSLSQSNHYSVRKAASTVRSEEADYAKFLVTSVPHCGEGCVYKVDLIISYGVWCIHRILELSLMESRPELWGKYTFVLNRLQGIIDLAFFKPRSPMSPCFCLQVPVGWQKSSPPVSKGSLPPHPNPGHGKCTTAAMLLDIIKDVELAISCRKGRTGTAAGDVAFPKGKENLASVLKRYKRRLSSKSNVSQESGPMSSRKVSSSQH